MRYWRRIVPAHEKRSRLADVFACNYTDAEQIAPEDWGFACLAQGIGMAPLVITALYAFLSIQVDGSSILDFLWRAACFLFLRQQFYEWGLN